MIADIEVLDLALRPSVAEIARYLGDVDEALRIADKRADRLGMLLSGVRRDRRATARHLPRKEAR